MTNVNQLITEHLDIWTSAVEKKSSAGRGNSGAVSLHGIMKLRELILELAIRGKLVSQDEKDDPAGVLLQRIENSTDEKQKQRKKTRQTTYDEAKPLFAAPVGWSWTPLSDVASVIRGVTYKKSDAISSEKTGYVPLLRGNNIGRTLNYDELVFVPNNLVKEDQLVRQGDIVIAMSSGSANLVGKASQSNDNIEKTFGAFCGVVRPLSSELNEFFRLFFQTPLYRNATQAAGKGIGINNLNKSVLERLWVPLPPLNEQLRIVAKVDELMALCDALERQAEDSLKAHQTLVETCLATLTNSQTPEDLTQNWTRIEAHFDTLFTTEESIHQLEEAVQELAVAGKLVPQHRSEDRNNQKQLRPDAKAEKFDLKAFEERAKKFVLPEGWAIEPLSRVSSNIVDCPHTTPKWTSEGELCVKSEQIFAGWIDLTNPKYVSRQTFVERIERLTPDEGDILYKREGGILGVGARIPPDTRVCLGQRLMLIRAGQSVRSDFLELVINSPWTRRFAKEKTTGGAAPRVNMTLVRAYPIPIPPLDEQGRIVSKVEDLRRLFTDMRARISAVQRLRTDIADTLTTKIH